MVICRAGERVGRVREGSQAAFFVTAALGFAEAITADEILRVAFSAVTAGADAVITGRSFDIVRTLANESYKSSVMGHLGFVPRKSTWFGSVRAVGKSVHRGNSNCGIVFGIWKTQGPSPSNAK